MSGNAVLERAQREHYDVVIVGGATIGSAIAWFLTDNPDFDGTVLVVEKDPTYVFSSTTRSNSCMRQQFSNKTNIRMSQFGARFVRDFRARLGDDPRVPVLPFHTFGYLYLACNDEFAQVLRERCALQQQCGAGTQLLSPDQLAQRFDFFQLDDVVLGSFNERDEGYFDSNTMVEWWRRSARERGVEYIANEVVAMTACAEGIGIASVTLASGEKIACGQVVNASGPRAARTASMAGIALSVEPRKRYTYVFDAQSPLDRDLPLTIDPSGVHVRTEGRYYMAGCPPADDPAVEYDDFIEDHRLWEDKVWPALATRIPQFEAIKVINSWVGHYAVNPLDHNAILGSHPGMQNFVFACGFSGHGTQHSPAVGRGIAELITYGEYRTLDLSEFSYQRLLENRPIVELAVI